MITKDKVTEIFCIIDEFDKNLSAEFAKNLRKESTSKCNITYNICKTPALVLKSSIFPLVFCWFSPVSS